MDVLALLKLAAATWYVAYVLTSSDGPGGVFAWIREHVWHGRHGVADIAQITERDNTGAILNTYKTKPHYPRNGLLDCPVCLSIWVAIILLLVPDGIIVQALAVAGIAMWAHGFTNWRLG
mgnify:CR=1 FL=1